MPNVNNLIIQYMSKILNNDQNKIQRPCNCRIKENYLLTGKCLHQCILYKAEVTTNISYKEYYETSEGKLKVKYNNHRQSFSHISHINDTELSKNLWTIEADRTDYRLKWSIKLYPS